MPIFLIVWRSVLVGVNLFCLLVLFHRWLRYRTSWRPYTHDFWWAQVLWSSFGILLPLEALLEKQALTAQTVFLTFITASTPYNLYRKGKERAEYVDTKDLH